MTRLGSCASVVKLREGRPASRSRDRCQSCEIVVEKFREQHGAKDVSKYYSKFDVGGGCTGALNVHSGRVVGNRATNRREYAVPIS
jgi:hypothetical protein